MRARCVICLDFHTGSISVKGREELEKRERERESETEREGERGREGRFWRECTHARKRERDIVIFPLLPVMLYVTVLCHCMFMSVQLICVHML